MLARVRAKLQGVSPQVKQAWGVYAGVALTEYSFATYIAGRDALDSHRAQTNPYGTEYEKVYKACFQDHDGRTMRTLCGL